MKRTITTLAIAATFAFSLISGFATTSYAGHKAPAKKVVSAVCPVMKSKIPDIKKAAGKSTYKGKTYYFYCAGCKPKFDKNPGKYVK